MGPIQDYNPELLKNRPPISCPALFADDNDVFSAGSISKKLQSPGGRGNA